MDWTGIITLLIGFGIFLVFQFIAFVFTCLECKRDIQKEQEISRIKNYNQKALYKKYGHKSVNNRSKKRSLTDLL